MQLHNDGKGHLYAEIENIRITYVPAKDRATVADWSGCDVIRVQAYRGTGDNSLHRGAELPISSAEGFGEFVAALCAVYIKGKQA